MVPRLMCIVSSDDDLTMLPGLVRAGVDAVQVRDKRLGRAGLLSLTSRVRALAPTAQVVVNDRLDVALEAGADGVHLGAADLPVAEARAFAEEALARGLLARRLLIGATCRSAADVLAASEDGADYAGVGPVFATTSKDGLPDPLGPEGLRAAVVPGGVPVLGIGGITSVEVSEVIAAGAHGVAVIGGIWRAADPVGAAQALAAVVCPGGGS